MYCEQQAKPGCTRGPEQGVGKLWKQKSGTRLTPENTVSNIDRYALNVHQSLRRWLCHRLCGSFSVRRGDGFLQVLRNRPPLLSEGRHIRTGSRDQNAYFNPAWKVLGMPT